MICPRDVLYGEKNKSLAEKVFLAYLFSACYNGKRTFLRGGLYRESKIIGETNLRKMQSYQKKRENHDNL